MDDWRKHYQTASTIRLWSAPRRTGFLAEATHIAEGEEKVNDATHIKMCFDQVQITFFDLD